jgi:hypothetical protein
MVLDDMFEMNGGYPIPYPITPNYTRLFHGR